jgi:hypothetical protein
MPFRHGFHAWTAQRQKLRLRPNFNRTPEWRNLICIHIFVPAKLAEFIYSPGLASADEMLEFSL